MFPDIWASLGGCCVVVTTAPAGRCDEGCTTGPGWRRMGDTADARSVGRAGETADARGGVADRGQTIAVPSCGPDIFAEANAGYALVLL